MTEAQIPERIWMRLDGYRPLSNAVYVLCSVARMYPEDIEYVRMPTMPQPDWNAAPEWARYYAIDADGREHWFENEPFLKPSYSWWSSAPHGEPTFGRSAYVRRPPKEDAIDWRQTLRKRPEVQE